MLVTQVLSFSKTTNQYGKKCLNQQSIACVLKSSKVKNPLPSLRANPQLPQRRRNEIFLGILFHYSNLKDKSLLKCQINKPFVLQSQKDWDGCVMLVPTRQSPIMVCKNYFCFGMRQAFESPDKRNHNPILIWLLTLQYKQSYRVGPGAFRNYLCRRPCSQLQKLDLKNCNFSLPVQCNLPLCNNFHEKQIIHVEFHWMDVSDGAPIVIKIRQPLYQSLHFNRIVV